MLRLESRRLCEQKFAATQTLDEVETVQLFSEFAIRSVWVAHVNAVFAQSCVLMIWEFWLLPLIAATVCFNTKSLNTANIPVAATSDSVHQPPMLTMPYCTRKSLCLMHNYHFYREMVRDMRHEKSVSWSSINNTK